MQRFIDSIADGVFMLAKCNSCSKFIWPPNIICSKCLNSDIEWVKVEPIGKVLSVSISYVSTKTSDAETFALIELEHGINLFASIEGSAYEGSIVKMIRCGLDEHGKPYYIFKALT